MLYTLKIKLHPSEQQKQELLFTMEQFNNACNFISKHAFDNKNFSKIQLQKEIYYQIRENYGLSSQMAVRAIGKVAESYKDKKKRCSLHKFKKYGAIVYDERILTVKTMELVSILVLSGRIEVPITICGYYSQIMNGNRVRGQADFGYIDGEFFLFLVVETPDEPECISHDFIGIDLGIVKIATTSDGKFFSGTAVKNMRKRYFKLRQRLQSKNTKSAKRLLKKRKRKEMRFAANVNHQISKRLVAIAKDTYRGLALEDLHNIKKQIKRVKGTGKKTVIYSKTMRQELSNWSFYQLRQFITYKAKATGVQVIFVDPKNTSRTCTACGNIDKNNRKSQSKFVCTACGYTLNADINAAENIRRRAAAIQPYAE